MTNACGLFPAIDARGHRTYCGPTAIAAITGLPIATIEAAVLVHRAKHAPPKRERMPAGVAVCSMWQSEVAPVCDLLGFVAHLVHDDRVLPSTLKRTLTQYVARERAGDVPKLVIVTGHFVAIHGRMFCDTFKRTPCNIREARHTNRCRVIMAWTITRKLSQAQ